MKLHRLELEGFGPFLKRQVVDFDAFDDDGLFLISGRTGAGKSSILDGACFALYGGVPRYDQVEKRLRSDHCAPGDPTQVRLEFSVGDTRWRVTRAPEYERPKARGIGFTPVPHTAQLEEWVEDRWIGRAAKPREVALRLDEILGLNQQQFLQVILLAQNRFAQFLLARNDDRQTLLRSLFGSRRFEDYQVTLDLRRKHAEESMRDAAREVDLLLDEAQLVIDEHDLGTDEGEDRADPVGRLDAVDRAAQRAAYRAETRERESDDAERAHVAAAAEHVRRAAIDQKRGQRDAARAAVAELREREPSVVLERARRDAAVRAEVLRQPIERASRAAVQAAEAADRKVAATAQWEAFGESAVFDADVLAREIDLMTGDLAVWEQAAHHERERTRLLQTLAALRERKARCEMQREASAADRARFPGQLAELDEAMIGHRDAAVRREPAQVALAAAERRLDAAHEAVRHQGALQASEAAHADTLAVMEGAISECTALLRRRLSGYAGELASALIDGEPCDVCGATAHPRPAPALDDPVTDAVLAAAEERKQAATAAERAAGERARVAREAHAQASARAGGESAEQLEAIVAEARGALAAAQAAAREWDACVQRRQELSAAAEKAADDDEELIRQIGETAQAIAVAEAQEADAHTAVTAAQGEFASVADRIRHTALRRQRASALREAIREHDAVVATAAGATAECATQIQESDFTDAAAVAEALMDLEQRRRLDDDIRAFEVALATQVARQRELELELAGESDEPIELAESADAVIAAKAMWQSAIAARARADQAAQQLRAYVSRTAQQRDVVAERAAAHELIAGLSHALSGRNPRKMNLETFVLAAELEEIVASANLRLDGMSSGRYLLRHTDERAARGAAGLGLEILDAYTGRARPPQSLSGGETFLVSLSLALGLAQVVTDRAGGIRLDTLFIDEGFGSLDPETLERAMRTLDELRQGGRTVGIISHVEGMREQIPAQLTVEATAQGPSVIRQDVSAI